MLENILIEYFGLKENWNDIEEEEQEIWNVSYNKLIDLIYSLERLGVLNSHKIIECLDEINDMEG